MTDIDDWTDEYSARFDKELRAAWPELDLRLQERICELSTWQLSFGPGDEFQTKVIQPEIDGWISRHVAPTIDAAVRDYRQIVGSDLDRIIAQLKASGTSGEVSMVDFLTALGGVGGTIAGGLIMRTAFSQITRYWVIATLAVSWPLFIAGLILSGLSLIWLVWDLAGYRASLLARMRDHLTPRLQEALIGEGCEVDGKHQPSLRVRINSWLRDAAAAAKHAQRGTP